jgi:hypothetical protein
MLTQDCGNTSVDLPDVQQTADMSLGGNIKVDQEYKMSDRIKSESAPSKYHQLLNQYNTQIAWQSSTPASEPREASLYHDTSLVRTTQTPDKYTIEHKMTGSPSVALLDHPRGLYAFKTEEGGLSVQKLEDPYFYADVAGDQDITYIVGKFTRPVTALYVDGPVTATFMEAEGKFGLISPPPNSANE